jgi:hypothetical protein
MLYLEILYGSIILLVMAVIIVVVYIIQFYDLEPLANTKTPEGPAALEPDKIV